MEAAHADVGGELVMLADGRDLWELADDMHTIPNTHRDFCSRVLKRELLLAWLDEHCDKADTTVHLGFDWTEAHRLMATLAYREGWTCELPLVWEPALDKGEILEVLKASGLPYPVAYQLGLPHNNCLRYGCVKGGHAYWRALLDQLPEVFARTEAKEEAHRERHGDFAILRDRRGGDTKPLPLRVFRERFESQGSLFVAADWYDPDDWGDCSCMGSLAAEG